ncbi:MAG: hypothetical protein EOM50_15765 [Erysipelotrichia bacterium]|nr:hypothetical protein [Erysipelotrichia bacterium]
MAEVAQLAAISNSKMPLFKSESDMPMTLILERWPNFSNDTKCPVLLDQITEEGNKKRVTTDLV